MPIHIPSRAVAVFLDFDGTLVDIAERPDRVWLPAATRETLTRLGAALDGAIAIVTGREIEFVDAVLSPFRCPVAGVHGLTRRNAAGQSCSSIEVPAFLDAAERQLRSLFEASPGLFVERKSRAIALHYRARPDLEAVCLAAMDAIAAGEPGIRVVRGKMVAEARPGGGDKGTAIADFLAERPFAGRAPLFAGDDVTDEDAFRVVNALEGISVKIGPGDTVAQHRLPSSEAFVAWLRLLADDLETGASFA